MSNKKVRVNVDVDKNLRQKIKETAIKKDKTQMQLIEEILIEYFGIENNNNEVDTE